MSIRSKPAPRRPTRAAAAGSPAAGFDLLTDVMNQVRLEGTVVFGAELAAPWGIEIVRDGRTPFYVIDEGNCELQVGRAPPLGLARGDLVLLPNAAPHAVRSDRGAALRPFDDWVAAHPMSPAGLTRHPGRGALTRVTGGFFSVDPLRVNPLFAALPAVIVLRGSDPAVARWLEPLRAILRTELDDGQQGARTVLQRLADVLFIQAVRTWALGPPAGRTAPAAAAPAPGASWLRALSDPPVARALALLHREPARPWTLPSLAQACGQSRTTLAVRFRARVGEAPMAYLSRWRITLAANRLRAGNDSLARIAEALGYGSTEVFAKAFRRLTGTSPARYRRERFGPRVPPGPVDRGE